ncbi:MAG: peptidylprolyl isomerase [Myxococcota bacterium]
MIADGKVVVIHYTLKGEDGAVIETTAGRDPLAYLHGHKNIIPGLERALLGKAAGESLTVTVPAADGYGEKSGKAPQEVPRREFPRKMELREGMPLQIRDSAGQPVQVWVTKVHGSKVWIGIDHPLAGRALTFEVAVLGVRDPTAEELEHGHAHGVAGHHGH